MTIIKTIESNNHRISLVGDGIVRVYSRGDVTENCIIDVFQKIDEIANGEKVLILIDPTEEKSNDKKAHTQIKVLGEKYCKGMAVLTRKPYAKTISNIIIKLVGPSFPIKLFTDVSEAEDWLKSL